MRRNGLAGEKELWAPREKTGKTYQIFEDLLGTKEEPGKGRPKKVGEKKRKREQLKRRDPEQALDEKKGKLNWDSEGGAEERKKGRRVKKKKKKESRKKRAIRRSREAFEERGTMKNQGTPSRTRRQIVERTHNET